MNKKKLFALTVLLTLLLTIGSYAEVPGADPAPATVKLLLFWGQGCPHCALEKEFLAGLQRRYPQLEIQDLEVWKNKENAKLFEEFAKKANLKSLSVPTTLIGNRLFIGFSDSTAAEIEATVKKLTLAAPTETNTEPSEEKSNDTVVDIPFMGSLDASTLSLPLLTIILGGLDSFNPCALFVLMFLLSLMVHARSRMRMLIVGGTFIFFSGFVYFLFMAAWLNFFFIVGNIALITTSAGVVALLAGGINIKDFFAFKKGVSLSLSDEAKPKLFERMRGLIKATSMTSVLMGTVVLAVAANAYELLCTAGFPMVYTRVLTLHNLPTSAYYVYLALYNVVYVIPLAVIVGLFVFTLGARKLTEDEGRILKLLSGLMMAYLGVALIIWPEVLNNLMGAAGILGLATASAVALYFIGRRFGIMK